MSFVYKSHCSVSQSHTWLLPYWIGLYLPPLSKCCCNKPPPTIGRNLNLFYQHIREISKVDYKKTLSCVCCMKPTRAFITSACWSHRKYIKFSWAYCLLEISCKQFYWFRGCSAGKKVKISFSRWWRLISNISLLRYGHVRKVRARNPQILKVGMHKRIRPSPKLDLV